MKRIITITISLILLLSVIISGLFLLDEALTPSNRQTRLTKVLRKFKKPSEGIEGYTTYKSRNPMLSFNFEYPRNWQISTTEIEKKKEFEIFILGPPEKTGIGAHLFIRVVAAKTAGYDNLDDLVNSQINRWKKSRDFKLFFDRETEFAGLQAREYKFSARIIAPSRLRGSARIGVVSTIVVQKGSNFYDIYYSAPAEVFHKYEEAYKRAKKTFKFIN